MPASSSRWVVLVVACFLACAGLNGCTEELDDFVKEYFPVPPVSSPSDDYYTVSLGSYLNVLRDGGVDPRVPAPTFVGPSSFVGELGSSTQAYVQTPLASDGILLRLEKNDKLSKDAYVLNPAAGSTGRPSHLVIPNPRVDAQYQYRFATYRDGVLSDDLVAPFTTGTPTPPTIATLPIGQQIWVMGQFSLVSPDACGLPATFSDVFGVTQTPNDFQIQRGLGDNYIRASQVPSTELSWNHTSRTHGISSLIPHSRTRFGTEQRITRISHRPSGGSPRRIPIGQGSVWLRSCGLRARRSNAFSTPAISARKLLRRSPTRFRSSL
jgi:hypothetical protein